MRALIVNGDDFGLTPGINAGVLHAHTRGILTSASLFANAPATDDAIAVALRTSTLSVGCHLTLVDGFPLSAASEVPTLAQGGRFRRTWSEFIRDAVLGRIRLHEIEREVTAQVQRLTEAGVRVTHLDSHKHVHAYPPIFALVARVARRCGIRTVRVPYETPAFAILRRYARHGVARNQALANLALGPWATRDRRLLDLHGLPPSPLFIGRALTGVFTRKALHALLESVPEGTSELMMHPGYQDAALSQVPTRLRQQRETEVALLTDPATRAVVARAGLSLTGHDCSVFVHEPLGYA
jgi:hopanoid biosynthesis associated protein HpnK